jgi:hypothetical protein
MAKTHRRTWQKREQKAAAAIGAKRQPGSGSSGREDQTRSDSVHPRLYLECKLRAAHAVINLWDDTAAKAKREKKTPLVCLSVKGRPGRWWLLHHRDVKRLAIEWLAHQDKETLNDVCKELWKAQNLEG